MTTPRRVSYAVAALLALWPVAAHAQQGPRDRQTRALIQQAMDDYQNLEIDSAVTRLRAALRGCGNNGCSPAVTARVHNSLGIVAIQGQNDTATGTNEFAEALRLDPSTELDQLLVTPEITHAFEEAQHRAGAGGGGGRTTGGGGGRTTGGAGNGGGGGGATLLHQPPTEQLENTPLPIFVENSGPAPASVFLYFKGNGMTQYRRLDMRRVANGYGVEVPCGQVIQGAIEYYVQAMDSSGGVSGNVGTEGSPMRVSIVTHRTTPAPSLPGQLPPETCGEECPPGMSGPQCHAGGGGGGASQPRGHAGLGDPCTANECGEGLHCDAGACSVGEPTSSGGGGEENPDHPGDDGTAPRYTRFSMDIGGGVGLAFLSGRPSYAEARNVVDPVTRMPTGQIDCASYRCSTNVDPGFAPTGFLSTVLRYDVSARLGLAGGVRFQFDTADTSVRSTTLPNLLLFGRLYYAYTGRGFLPSGLTGSVFVGGGGGQIEPKPALPARETRPSAHVLSGFGNFHAGTRIEYGTRSGFHVAGELSLNFMAPTFLFDADITAFVGYNF